MLTIARVPTMLTMLLMTALAAAEPPVPPHLANREAAWRQDPRAAAQAWFREAKLGLFVHYGLVSLLPGGKTGSRPGDPSATELRRRYTAERFDANALADLAVAAGMRYICFTPYHGGGPYNFGSAVAHPNTVEDLPAKRDLVGELAKACQARGLGLFLYVHCALSQSGDDVRERNTAIWREWCTHYGPLAGFWCDTDSLYYKERQRYPRLAEMYALLRGLQPHALLSFCHGVTGDEDYLTYEHRFHEQSEFKYVPAAVQRQLADKTVELVTTLQLDRAGGRGTKMWFNVDGAYHRTVDEVWAVLAEARSHGANLMVNTGLLGDGSVHPADAATLRELGRRLTERGFPSGPAAATTKEGEDR